MYICMCICVYMHMSMYPSPLWMWWGGAEVGGVTAHTIWVGGAVNTRHGTMYIYIYIHTYIYRSIFYTKRTIYRINLYITYISPIDLYMIHIYITFWLGRHQPVTISCSTSQRWRIVEVPLKSWQMAPVEALERRNVAGPWKFPRRE